MYFYNRQLTVILISLCYLTTLQGVRRGVDKTWGRPWPTLWPTLWPTGGQIFKSIVLQQTFQRFPRDCLTNGFLLLFWQPHSAQNFLNF